MPSRARTPAPPSAASPGLVADIGGTRARFGWVDAGAAAAASGHPPPPVQHVHTLEARDFTGPADAVRSYLATLAHQLGPAYRPPRSAAFAAAAAITGDRVTLLNSGWDFSQRALQAELALDHLRLLNDFEALALALPHLQPAQLRWHPGSGAGATPLPMAVIGPGTGLGVAGVVPLPGRRWCALASEGGHATLAPGDDFESALIAHVRRSHAHVSAERLLSGIGLPLLHQAVIALRGEVGAELATEQVVQRGLAGDDPACRQTLEVFCALLGSFAGSVALILGARGGVFVGGGIVPRMRELFFASRFRQRFEAKGRLQGYLAAVPTALITDTLAALTGAAAVLGTDS